MLVCVAVRRRCGKGLPEGEGREGVCLSGRLITAVTGRRGVVREREREREKERERERVTTDRN